LSRRARVRRARGHAGGGAGRTRMMDFPRIKRLPPYVFNIVGDLKQAARRAGEDIIDLGMGTPDGATPAHVVQKLVESAAKVPNHRYSVSRGIYKLRVAICAWYRRRYGVELDPDSEAIATIGSKEGIGHLALAMLGPGDVVMCPSPTYPIHQYSVVIAGGDLRSIPLMPGGREVGVEFFTLSKSYNMPGWRIGFAVGHPEIIAALARIKSYLDYGTF